MKYWLLYISSALLSLSVLAQNPPPPGEKGIKGAQPELRQNATPKPAKTDSLVQKETTVANDSISDQPIVEEKAPKEPKTFFTPQIYIDYGKLITTAVGLENKLEGSLSFLFYETFELIGEAGIATLKPEHAYSNGSYESSGKYYRVGGGYMTAINSKSNIGLGVRYGQSNFKDKGEIHIESGSGLQDNYSYIFTRPNNLTARWCEAVLTSESRLIFNKDKPESKINDLVKLGFFFRVRFLISYDNFTGPDEIEVYSIPGYGSAVNKQQVAFNLYVKFTPW